MSLLTDTTQEMIVGNFIFGFKKKEKYTPFIIIDIKNYLKAFHPNKPHGLK